MHNPRLHSLLVTARADDLRRAASRPGFVRHAARRPHAIPADSAVTLRFAFPDDERALLRLAALDSSAAPAAPVLLAEIGGHLRAAVSLADGHTLADPFHHCEWLLVLLRARAKQLSLDSPRVGRAEWILGRLRLRLVRQRANA